MNRPIKFRAWYASVGLMSPPFDLLSVPLLVDEDVLMQFTGLHDKNGKEIYEGDIVNFDTWENEQWYPVQGEVAFLDGAFRLNSSYADYLDQEAGKVVIGNLYENPDLLSV